MGFARVKIVIGAARSVGRGGQTDIDLDGRVVELYVGPICKRNVGRALTVDVIHTRPGRAVRGVVELNKQKVEPDVRDNVAKVCIRDNTLRCGGDEIFLRGILGEESLLEGCDHFRVAAGLVIGDSGAVVCRRRATRAFNVKVKAIDDRITEGARFVGICPCRGLRAKGTPEEIGEGDGACVACNVVIGRVAATERQQYLLAICLLASLDIRTDIGATRQQVGANTVVLVGIAGACVAEICARIASRTLVRKDVDEADDDDVDVGVHAGLDQPLLIRALTPVDGYIVLGRGGERSAARKKEGKSGHQSQHRGHHLGRL